MTKTALIAGGGRLPTLLVEALRADNVPFVLAEMEGFPAEVADAAPLIFRLERLVPFLVRLADEGVTRVCFAGAVRRPKIEPELFDPRTAALVPRLLAAIGSGDDAALRAVIGIFEEFGFDVVGAHEVLPDLLPRVGVLTQASPDAHHEDDAELGEETVAVMGREDSGQACIIAQSRIVAREGCEGTDAMMRGFVTPKDKQRLNIDPFAAMLEMAFDYVTNLRREPSPGNSQHGGILFKAPKPGQDRRIDLPVIGPATAMLAAEIGLAGLVIEAGGVMILELEQTRAILDSFGMFLWVRPHGGQS